MKGNRIGRAIPFLASLAAAAVAACSEGGSPPARGFGSRQLLSSSDPNLRTVGFAVKVESSTGPDGTKSYSSTTDLDILWYQTGDGKVSPVEYWALDLRDGAVEPLGPTLPDVKVPPPEPPPGSLDCEYRFVDGASALVITDPVSGVETEISSVTFYSRCPRQDDRHIQVIRRDETSKRGRLWAGPFDALEMVPLGISIAQIVPTGSGGDQLLVLSAADAAPEDLRLDQITLSSLTVQTVVPAALSADAAWTGGAAVVTQTLESDRLALGDVNWLGSFGVTYPRQMRDSSTIMFARRFQDPPGREVALFPLRGNAGHILMGSVESERGVGDVPVPFAAWWEFPGVTGGTGVTGGIPAVPGSTPEPLRPSAMYVWDLEQLQLTSCPLPSGFPGLPFGRVMPWANAILFDGKNGLDSNPKGPLLLYLADQQGDRVCRVMADSGASQEAWSTEALVWHENTGGEESTLRVVRFDGSDSRVIGTGWLQFPHFVAPLELQFFFGSDLVAVDLRDDPVRLNYLAEGVFGAFINWGVSVITGYGYNTQDGTGSLGVVHRPTGERRLISTAVDNFLFAYRPGDGEVDVVYRVRGRNASAQDGIWIATIPYDELD